MPELVWLYSVMFCWAMRPEAAVRPVNRFSLVSVVMLTVADSAAAPSLLTLTFTHHLRSSTEPPSLKVGPVEKVPFIMTTVLFPKMVSASASSKLRNVPLPVFMSPPISCLEPPVNVPGVAQTVSSEAVPVFPLVLESATVVPVPSSNCHQPPKPVVLETSEYCWNMMLLISDSERVRFQIETLPMEPLKDPVTLPPIHESPAVLSIPSAEVVPTYFPSIYAVKAALFDIATT